MAEEQPHLAGSQRNDVQVVDDIAGDRGKLHALTELAGLSVELHEVLLIRRLRDLES